MSTTRTPQICSDFSGDAGDTVQWQGLPATCRVSQITTGSNTTFPFSPTQGSNGSYYIDLPSANAITITSGLAPNTYYFNVSCCKSNQATHTVRVN
jgi:hypothetical protein